MKLSHKKSIRLYGVSLAVAASFIVGEGAHANSMFSGQLNFAGSVTVENASGKALNTNLSGAAALDFGKYTSGSPAVTVTNATRTTAGSSGSFSGIAARTNLTMANFSFNGLPASISKLPVILLKVGDYTFTLNALKSETVTGSGALFLVGTGMLSGGSYTPTLANFNFSSQPIASGSQVSYSGSVTAVPVPAAMILTAPVLFGLMGFSRRKKGANTSA